MPKTALFGFDGCSNQCGRITLRHVFLIAARYGMAIAAADEHETDRSIEPAAGSKVAESSSTWQVSDMTTDNTP
jgi:hypothetical protein